MDTTDLLKKAEELANNVDEKYQNTAFQELLRYYLFDSSSESAQATSPISVEKAASASSRIPKASLIKNEGSFKQQVVWAILKLHENDEDGTVKNVQRMIDLQLSLPEPNRSHTSTTLGDLVPDYLGRKEPDEGRGYLYVPNEDTFKIFDDLGQE